jgi:hypothetical protein
VDPQGAHKRTSYLPPVERGAVGPGHSFEPRPMLR